MDMEFLYELKKGGANCGYIAESATLAFRIGNDDIHTILEGNFYQITK